jgi:hypothetical protein
MWVLSNNNNNISNKTAGYSNYSIETNVSEVASIKQSANWILSGHVSARNKVEAGYKKFQGIDLLEALYQKQGEDFIQYITGQFIIIHFELERFTIYSDHFAIKKFFIWQSGKCFIISDNLNKIAQNVQLRSSLTGMANYAIDYHFTGGTTAFENVRHNEPGQVIEYKESALSFTNYWKPEDLLKLEKHHIPITEITAALSKAVESDLKNIDKEKVSLSITGGADTRNLLAIFLSKGIKPHLYTYGNPVSDDCIKAKAIADGLGLKHNIHDIQMTAELFEEYARKIVKQSGGLASIHRAHRIIAVEEENQFTNNMFLGSLGGEFIKGIDHDDYITSALLFENWSQSISIEMIMRAMKQKNLKTSNAILVDTVFKLFLTHPYIEGNSTLRKHNALSYITAHLHDAQDINLYCNALNGQVFTPFLNIDYLELIFSSQYTFDNKEKIKNKYMKKVNYPVYASNFIKATYPPLLNFLYTGDHKPSEVLFNKYYAALIKMFRKRKTKGKYKPNFPLDKWMEEFVEKNLPMCYEYEALKTTFDLNGLMQELKTGNHKPKESYWLKFTNPIMMRFIIEEFA